MRTYKARVGKYFMGPVTLGEFLMKLTPLTPSELGDVASKGGVWIQRKGKGRILRIRILKESLSPDDVVSVFFDPKVLALPPLTSLDSLYEDSNYGVWIKPAGVVPQGSQASDHASVLRFVELRRGKEVFLVHRLDRETEGLMLVAYQSQTAGKLSDLFKKNKIHKSYEAIVLGELPPGHKETIRASLDDKEAVTHLEVIASGGNQSHLKLTIETGRLHQIRRHLDFIGHPIMGDPKYGKGNKNKKGLQLIAKSLAFRDPWTGQEVDFHHPRGLFFDSGHHPG